MQNKALIKGKGAFDIKPNTMQSLTAFPNAVTQEIFKAPHSTETIWTNAKAETIIQLALYLESYMVW